MNLIQFIIGLLPNELKPFAVAFMLGAVAASLGLILDPVFLITITGLWLISPWLRKKLTEKNNEI